MWRPWSFSRRTYRSPSDPIAAAAQDQVENRLAEEVIVTGTRGEEPVLQEKNADQVKIDNDLLRECRATAATCSLLHRASSRRPRWGDSASIVVDGWRAGVAIPTSGIRRMLINLNPYSAVPASGKLASKLSPSMVAQAPARQRGPVRSQFSADAKNAFAPSKPPLDRDYSKNGIRPFPAIARRFF